ncbi:MAG: hypothetical protein LBQ48_01690 [Oscillospiraceae bacterium]|jgi:urease accessory protein|nr:hypothetical protein [Oscillospiraceae bacterium]
MDRQLLLAQALDPLFPIGGYTLSNGLETYAQKGLVHSEETLSAYLNAQLFILPFSDLGIAAKAAEGEDFVLLDHISAASKSPKEIRRGSEKLCANFLKAQSVLGDYPLLLAYRRAVAQGHCDGHYPVAVGLFIRELALPPGNALRLYCYSLLSAAVNHAVKLVPLRQLDGQRALSGALSGASAAVEKAIRAETKELGASGCGFDLRAVQHESLSGRLYIS